MKIAVALARRSDICTIQLPTLYDIHDPATSSPLPRRGRRHQAFNGNGTSFLLLLVYISCPYCLQVLSLFALGKGGSIYLAQVT